nr:unnamed protein product [Spirometra erinaceieuropaei]
MVTHSLERKRHRSSLHRARACTQKAPLSVILLFLKKSSVHAFLLAVLIGEEGRSLPVQASFMNRFSCMSRSR